MWFYGEMSWLVLYRDDDTYVASLCIGIIARINDDDDVI